MLTSLIFRYNDSIAFHDIACYHKTRFICEDSELLLQEALEMTNEEIQDENEEKSTKNRVVEVEITSRRIEVEKATRKIEPEETSRRMKAVETTTPQVVNVEKANQSGDEERKKPQRRRKIARKKLQPEIGKENCCKF